MSVCCYAGSVFRYNSTTFLISTILFNYPFHFLSCCNSAFKSFGTGASNSYFSPFILKFSLNEWSASLDKIGFSSSAAFANLKFLLIEDNKMGLGSP